MRKIKACPKCCSLSWMDSKTPMITSSGVIRYCTMCGHMTTRPESFSVEVTESLGGYEGLDSEGKGIFFTRREVDENES